MLTAMTEDTRKEVVSGILDCFEELLDKLEITIPCADTEEEEERKMDDNSARLYEHFSLGLFQRSFGLYLNLRYDNIVDNGRRYYS